MPSDVQFLTQSFVDMFNGMAARQDNRHFIEALGAKQYLREFNTMLLNVPRQVGKTSALVQILLHRGDNAILVAPNHNIKRYIESSFGLEHNRIWTARGLLETRGKTFRNRFYLFDEWQYIPKSDMDTIVSTMFYNRPREYEIPVIFGLGTR